MKNKMLTIIAVAGLGLFTACTGNNSSHKPDTTDTQPEAPKSVDTTKPTTTTGDASQLDNSGNGGQAIAKDTAKYVDSAKKH